MKHVEVWTQQAFLKVIQRFAKEFGRFAYANSCYPLSEIFARKIERGIGLSSAPRLYTVVRERIRTYLRRASPLSVFYLALRFRKWNAFASFWNFGFWRLHSRWWKYFSRICYIICYTFEIFHTTAIRRLCINEIIIITRRLLTKEFRHLWKLLQIYMLDILKFCNFEMIIRRCSSLIMRLWIHTNSIVARRNFEEMSTYKYVCRTRYFEIS